MGQYETIETIWQQLNEYQNNVHQVDHTWLAPREQMEKLRQYTLALNIEIAEFIQHFPWKPWNYAKFTETDCIAAAEEWADCLVFLFDMALAVKLEPKDLNDAFKRVMIKNWSRRKEANTQNANQ